MYTGILLMRKFGITTRYQGYFLLPEAIGIVMEQYGSCLKITKDIYPEMSKRHGIPDKRIERNIRTVIEKAWENNRPFMEEIAGRELNVPPSNGEFLDFIVYWLMEQQGGIEEKKKMMRNEKHSV